MVCFIPLELSGLMCPARILYALHQMPDLERNRQVCEKSMLGKLDTRNGVALHARHRTPVTTAHGPDPYRCYIPTPIILESTQAEQEGPSRRACSTVEHNRVISCAKSRDKADESDCM
jgi:hypothetical protein